MVIRGREFPHIKAVMYNNMLGDNQTIVRGEPLTILRLMWAQLKRSQVIKHMMAPVIYSSYTFINILAGHLHSADFSHLPHGGTWTCN